MCGGKVDGVQGRHADVQSAGMHSYRQRIWTSDGLRKTKWVYIMYENGIFIWDVVSYFQVDDKETETHDSCDTRYKNIGARLHWTVDHLIRFFQTKPLTPTKVHIRVGSVCYAGSNFHQPTSSTDKSGTPVESILDGESLKNPEVRILTSWPA